MRVHEQERASDRGVHHISTPQISVCGFGVSVALLGKKFVWLVCRRRTTAAVCTYVVSVVTFQPGREPTRHATNAEEELVEGVGAYFVVSNARHSVVPSLSPGPMVHDVMTCSAAGARLYYIGWKVLVGILCIVHIHT